jgi:uncharacterized OB-fold protein
MPGKELELVNGEIIDADEPLLRRRCPTCGTCYREDRETCECGAATVPYRVRVVGDWEDRDQ